MFFLTHYWQKIFWKQRTFSVKIQGGKWRGIYEPFFEFLCWLIFQVCLQNYHQINCKPDYISYEFLKHICSHIARCRTLGIVFMRQMCEWKKWLYIERMSISRLSSWCCVKKKQNKNCTFIIFFYFCIRHRHSAQEQNSLHSEESAFVFQHPTYILEAPGKNTWGGTHKEPSFTKFQMSYVMAGFSSSLEIIDNFHLLSVAPADMKKI